MVCTVAILVRKVEKALREKTLLKERADELAKKVSIPGFYHGRGLRDGHGSHDGHPLSL